ncbi:unnamed protein product [Caretta caretta]
MSKKSKRREKSLSNIVELSTWHFVMHSSADDLCQQEESYGGRSSAAASSPSLSAQELKNHFTRYFKNILLISVQNPAFCLPASQSSCIAERRCQPPRPNSRSDRRGRGFFPAHRGAQPAKQLAHSLHI